MSQSLLFDWAMVHNAGMGCELLLDLVLKSGELIDGPWHGRDTVLYLILDSTVPYRLSKFIIALRACNTNRVAVQSRRLEKLAQNLKRDLRFRSVASAFKDAHVKKDLEDVAYILRILEDHPKHGDWKLLEDFDLES